MASPLAPYSTAQLTFSIESSGLTSDELGNLRPKTSLLTVLAFLKANAGVTRQYGAGKDPQAVYLQGYATDPSNLSEYEIGNRAAITIGGMDGVFELDFFPNSPFGRNTFGTGTNIGKIVEEALGTKLQGWFIPNRGS